MCVALEVHLPHLSDVSNGPRFLDNTYSVVQESGSITVDVLEFKIASFVGRSGLLAVSGSMDPQADQVPGASGSSG
jgi:hypothetical protein